MARRSGDLCMLAVVAPEAPNKIQENKYHL
jgi:hypothetical protein